MAGRFDALAILGVWAIEPLSSIAFLPRHLVPQLTYIILVLGAVGASAVVRPRTPAMHWLHLAGWGGVAVFGWFDGKLALVVAGLMVLLTMALIDLLRSTSASFSSQPAASFLLLLSAGLILRTPFHFPNYAALGTTSEELAIHFLEAHVPKDSLVMSPYPGPAIAAKMSDVGPGDVPQGARTPGPFLAWVQAKDIAAIYLDRQFKRSEEVYDLASSLVGDGLRVAYTTPDGRIRILQPTR
jgi:hypothetical protein